MIPPKTAGEFVQVLEQSRLIAPAHLDRIRSKVPPPDQPGFDALTFARAVVKEGMLTPFQAGQLMTGRRKGFFVGKYRLLDVLGRGGMGKVYLAEQMTMKRAVALKVVRIGGGGDADLRVRFAREARAAARLRHPNITQAYDFDQAAGYHYIAMEFVEGITLQEWVGKAGPLPWALAASYVSQAADALGHAWEHGLVHRDVKPGNLMVDTGGGLKLLDLGLVILPSVEDSVTLMQRDLILGTPDYLSPEQAMNSHEVDIRADLYSLGAVFFFLLTGRPPFAGKSAAAKIIAHQTQEPQPIQELVPEVPKKLAEALHRMMAKKPEDRPRTPAEVVKALRPFAQLATRAAPPYDPSLVRFTRAQVEKYLRYSADAPPGEEGPDSEFGRRTLGEFRIPPDVMTPRPAGELSSAGGARHATPTPGTAPAGDRTPSKPLRRLSPSTQSPSSRTRVPIPRPRAKALRQAVEQTPAAVDTSLPPPENAAPVPGGKRRFPYLFWLVFAVPNVLALILLYALLMRGW